MSAAKSTLSSRAIHVLFVANLLALTLLYLQTTSGPWVDELSTFMLSRSPAQGWMTYLTDSRSDYHPFGYYFLASLGNSLFGFGNIDSIADYWQVIKIVGTVFPSLFFVLLTIGFAWAKLRDRPTSAQLYLLVVPALVSFAAVFGLATDFRSYGTQAIGAILIAISMTVNSEKNQLTQAQVIFFTASLGLLGSLHIWSTSLAFWFLVSSLAIWPSARLKIIVYAFLISLPMVLISYLPGPLSNLERRGIGEEFVVSDWILGLAAGFSFHLALAIPIFALWAWAAKSSSLPDFLIFFLPGLMTILSMLALSLLVTPVFKWYSLSVVYAVFAAGTILQLSFMRKANILISLFIANAVYTSLNPMNVMNDDAIWTSQGAIFSKQNWDQTSKVAINYLEEKGGSRLFTRLPKQLGLLIPNYDLISLDKLASIGCQQPEVMSEIVVVNHLSLSDQQDLQVELNLSSLEIFPTGGVYLYDCNSNSR